jgi:putative membrane protein
MWDMHDVGAGWWIVMSLGMIAFWALVIWAVAAAARGMSADRRRQDSSTDEPGPIETLQRRLARGEISPEEYRRLRETLRDDADYPDPTSLRT